MAQIFSSREHPKNFTTYTDRPQESNLSYVRHQLEEKFQNPLSMTSVTDGEVQNCHALNDIPEKSCNIQNCVLEIKCSINQESYEHQTGPLCTQEKILPSQNGQLEFLTDADCLASIANASLCSKSEHADEQIEKNEVVNAGTSITKILASSLYSTQAVNVSPADQKRAGSSVALANPPSKKQKLVGDPVDQDLDPMTKVMTSSGVNLREEQEKLLLGHQRTYVPRISADNSRSFLELKAVHNKVLRQAQSSNIPNVSEDVALCLSMSVEELFRSIVSRVIKFARKRRDEGKGKHKIEIISDVGQRITVLKEEAKKASEAKEIAERYKEDQKSVEENADGKAPEASRSKALKGRKSEKAKAASTVVAPRATDEMLIKWQIMAEQARLKRERENVAGTEVDTKTQRPQPVKHVSTSVLSSIPQKAKPSTIASDDFGRPPGSVSMAPSKLRGNNITARDLIAVLETDSRMAKSTLLFKSFNKDFAKSLSR